MRGAVSPVQLVLILIVLAALAAAAWWWYVGQRGGSTLAPTAGSGAATAPAAGEAPPLPTAELSVNELYKAARGAMAANRMVTPPGNNALEYYLAIMARQPDDSGAIDAVRELFPFATGSAEDQINQGNYEEATRIMSLLAQADPSNYSLTILRSKLDAKRKQVERDQQLQAQQAAAAARTQTAATPAAPAAAAPDAVAPAAPTAPATSTAAASRPTEVARATPPPAAAPPPAPAPAPAPVGETRDARMTTAPQPEYPATAARNRQSGWVEVEFTVAADGSVQNARAVSSSPPRVFDREAVRAIQQAKFEPRLDRGQPVAATLRRRIEFKLGN